MVYYIFKPLIRYDLGFSKASNNGCKLTVFARNLEEPVPVLFILFNNNRVIKCEHNLSER